MHFRLYLTVFFAILGGCESRFDRKLEIVKINLENDLEKYQAMTKPGARCSALFGEHYYHREYELSFDYSNMEKSLYWFNQLILYFDLYKTKHRDWFNDYASRHEEWYKGRLELVAEQCTSCYEEGGTPESCIVQ